VLGGAQPARADDLPARRTALYAAYDQQLQGLAQWCAARNLAAEAQTTKHWQPAREPDKQLLFLPSESFAPPWKGTPPTAEQADWWQKFVALRKAQAERLFALAKQALQEHHLAAAFELAAETARENPDCEPAQIILGHQKYENAWYTPFSVARLRGGDVWHPKYGWIPHGQVERYEQGLRWVNNRWIKADEDARLHASIQNGWRIDTEHYVVLTNHSLEEGVALSRRLERLFEVWQQVYLTFHMSESELNKLFVATAAPRPLRKQHQVMYFRDRDEYNQALVATQPNISKTLGAYFDTTHTVYFFAGDEQDEGTVNHEATHQLFQETRAVGKDFARRANFWSIEAAACYMESMVVGDGYVTLGGFNEGRVPAARKRLLQDQFYVPLSELTAMGMDAFQRDDRLPKIYSESSGLAQFFMHAHQNAYRDPFVAYLDAVYLGKATNETLAKLMGKSYEELDREYRDYLHSAR
jgi:hypothetical protein